MPSEPHNSVEVFYSYAHEDEKLRDELKKHLANLKRQGVITDRYDRDISAGAECSEQIARLLESAKVILLLISPDFMNSDYINDSRDWLPSTEVLGYFQSSVSRT